MTLSRKIYFPITLLLTALAVLVAYPVHAVTVSQDITLQATDGSDITMLASSAFDSMTVNSTGFSFTLSGTQSVSLRDTDAQVITTNVDGVTGSCDGASSSVTLQASKSLSFQVFIEGFACSGGGGGGGSYTPSTTTTDTTITTTTSDTTTTTTTTDATSTTDTTSAYLEGAPPPAMPLGDGTVISPVLVSSVAFPGINDLSRGLTVGSTGSDVTVLQEALASMSDIYPEGIVSGYFGSLTKAAVEKFQMKYGVVSSASDAGYGYVGPMTRAKLKEVFGMSTNVAPPPVSVSTVSALTRELGMGDDGDDVTRLQVFLAADPSLYPEGKVTGYYGSLTTSAVRRFQAMYGISQVGRVGPQTLAKLNELMGGTPSSSVPDSSDSTGDTVAREALQNQIDDLNQLLNSLMQQVQSAQ
jgi:peptidoglycan hydrolase-like protein with peptidoglycan-binding domain